MHIDVLASPEPPRLSPLPRDLTDPAEGAHAVQLVLDAAMDALASAWSCAVVVRRAVPLVVIDAAGRADEAQRLPHPIGALRAGTSAVARSVLPSLADLPSGDVLLVCPGLGAQPSSGDASGGSPRHQVDLWRIRRGAPLGLRDLAEMIGPVAAAVVPGFTISAVGAPLPGTVEARKIDVRLQGKWVEFGRCGLVARELLGASGLPPDASAVAMTLDLDRLVMLAKGIDDPTLLRSRQRGVAEQMLDLEPFVPVAASRPSPRRRALAPATAPTLADVRASIDDVDARIVELLAERRSYVVQAARFKRSVHEVRVPAREEQVIANVRAAASRAGIEPDMVEDLYRHVIDSLVKVEIAAHRGAGA